MKMRSMVLTVSVFLLAESGAWAVDGAAVYKEQCAKCHGETGASDTAVGKALKIPPLAGEAGLATMPVADISAKIRNAEKHPPALKEMSAHDLDAAAEHVKKLAGGN